MKLKISTPAICLGFGLVLTASASAINLTGVASTTGSIEQIFDNNVDLSIGSYESDDNIRLFYEGTGTFGSDWTVYTNFDGSGDPISTTIDGTTQVRSYLLHWDPDQSVGEQFFTNTTIAFSESILGFLGPAGSLDDTDNLFESDIDFSGLKGKGGRQAGFGTTNDEFAVGGTGQGDAYFYNPFTVTKLSINIDPQWENVDQIRIFTAVPEPTTVIGLLSGVGLLGFQTLRRRKAKIQAAI